MMPTLKRIWRVGFLLGCIARTELNDADLNLPARPEFDAWLTNWIRKPCRLCLPKNILIILSAFGHSLLKIDSTASLNDPKAIYEAHALNDTVDGNPDDNFAVYAYVHRWKISQ